MTPSTSSPSPNFNQHGSLVNSPAAGSNMSKDQILEKVDLLRSEVATLRKKIAYVSLQDKISKATPEQRDAYLVKIQKAIIAREAKANGGSAGTGTQEVKD